MLNAFPIMPEKGPNFINQYSKYDSVNIFGVSEGLIPVKLNNKWGFSNKKGKLIIPCSYDYVSYFSEGLAAVKLNNKFGVIDKSNNLIIPHKYDYIKPCINGLFSTELDGKFGAIDKSNNLIIPHKYDYIFSFYNNLAVIVLNEKYGMINIDNKIVLDILYDDIINEDEYYCAAFEFNKNYKYGIINNDGKLIIPCEYKYIIKCDSFFICQSFDNHSKIFDKNGNLCISDLDIEDANRCRYNKKFNKYDKIIDLYLTNNTRGFIDADNPTVFNEFMNYIDNIGSRSDTLYYTKYKDTYILTTGCFFGDLDSFEEAVNKETHEIDSKYYNQYMKVINNLKEEFI